MFRAEVRYFLGILVIACLVVAGCADREDPLGPDGGTRAVSDEIPDPGGCVVREQIEICRLPTLGGVEGEAADVNDLGWIVGKSETAAGPSRPTLWLPGETVDLGDLGFFTVEAVSNGGWVAGSAIVSDRQTAARWSESTGFESLELTSPLLSARALGVNDAGEVGGEALVAPLVDTRALKWTTTASVVSTNSFAADINNAGAMVGWGEGNDGNTQAAAIIGDQVDLLGPLAGDVSSIANGMNELDPIQLVGWSQAESPYRLRGLRVDGTAARELPGLAGDWTIAHDINDAGYVVGESAPEGTSPTRAVLWTPDDELVELGGLAGPEAPGVAYGINSDGLIVGYSEDNGTTYPTTWRLLGDEQQPPIADAGPDQTVECSGEGSAQVTLDGSGSSDPDGDELQYTWTLGGNEIATGATPTVMLPLGVHTITLTVDDGNGGTDSDDVVVTVQDTQAPVIDLTIATTELWPPNHKMVLVAAGVSATDACCDVTLEIEVESNEPPNGTGDGDTEPDYEIVSNDDGSFDVWLRAERAGGGEGRRYTITATATDCSGNTSQQSGIVRVPKSKGKKKG